MLNIAVCGKFHYPKYLAHLNALGYLGDFYCAARRGARFGIPAAQVHNHYAKEYLYHLHLRVLGEHGLESCARAYHGIWQTAVERIFTPADINLFMVHGNCGRLIEKCQRAGAATVGEAVNAHPTYQTDLLKQEAAQLGLDFSAPAAITGRMLEEFDAVDHLLVPSNFALRSFIDQGYPASKLIYLPYGVDRPPISIQTKAAKPRAMRSPIKVLCVGQVMLRKGQWHLVRAVHALNRAAGKNLFELTLVGRADPAYLAHLSSLGLAFAHVDHVPNASMIDYMRGFDIFVLPSIEDGFGLVVPEALSAGLPVIVTANSGAAELIVDGANGVVVPSASSAAIMQALERVVDEGITAGSVSLPGWPAYAAELKTRLQALEVAMPGLKHG